MSSKRAVRRKACTGKTRFPTFGDAQGALKALIRKAGNEGWPMNAYRCRFCGGYHFGHTPMKAVLARRRSK